MNFISNGILERLKDPCFKQEFDDLNAKNSKVDNLLEEENPLILTNFLYFKGSDGYIFADEAIFYKNIGFFLYLNGECIFSFKGNIDKVTYMKLYDDSSHYYIHSSDNSRGMYLIVEEPLSTDLKERNLVVIKGDDSYKMYFLLRNHPEAFDNLFEEIKNQFIWEIVEIKESLLAVIQKNNEIKTVWLSDLISFEEMKNTPFDLYLK